MIKIWDFNCFEETKENYKEDLENELKENDFEDSRLLATLNDHTKTVMCVRWSKDGQFLASGGDDKLIIIWKLMNPSGNEFGNLNQTQNIENWKVFKVLTGHKGDISDICWSQDNRFFFHSQKSFELY